MQVRICLFGITLRDNMYRKIHLCTIRAATAASLLSTHNKQDKKQGTFIGMIIDHHPEANKTITIISLDGSGIICNFLINLNLDLFKKVHIKIGDRFITLLYYVTDWLDALGHEGHLEP
ncbi:hypothetical protein ACJX0J_040697 [Zea mays]